MDTQNRWGRRIWLRLPGRTRRSILAGIAISAIGISAAWSQTPPPGRATVLPGSNAAERTSRLPAKERLREGTELKDTRGYFRFMDDRVVFFEANGEGHYIGLENLNLERIVSEITNNPTQLEWTIVGTITEFRGTNFVLVRRAVLSRNSNEFDSQRPASLSSASPPK